MSALDPATAAALQSAEDVIRRAGAGGPELDPALRSLHAGDAVTTRLSDVAPERVRWIWPARIPLGRLTVLDGDPGLGKSTLCLDIAARLSLGSGMPDGSRCELGTPAGTVLLTAEDGLADTVRPRLDAAGADPTLITALRGIRCGETGEEQRLPTLADVDAIETAICEVNAALIIVDPLTAYLGRNVDSHRDQDVRSALAGLGRLAEQLGVAVLAIRHVRKSGGSNPLHVGGGSIGIIAAARSGLLAVRDPSDPSSARRILATTKCNLALEPPSLGWELEPTGGTVHVRWTGPDGRSAADLVTAPDPEERGARERAADYLRDVLADGPLPADRVMRGATATTGASRRTVERARVELGVESVQRRDKAGRVLGWDLRLPESPGRHSGESGGLDHAGEMEFYTGQTATYDAPRPSASRSPEADGGLGPGGDGRTVGDPGDLL